MKLFLIADILKSLKILISTAQSELIAPKLIAGLKVAIIMSPFSLLGGLRMWADENSLYVSLVMGAILCDWFLGTIKHAFWCKDFHWKENIKGILVKCILVIIMGGVYEGIQHFTVDVTGITKYIINILRLTVFMYPAMSIVRSSRVISDGKFPPQGIYNAIEKWTANLGTKN